MTENYLLVTNVMSIWNGQMWNKGIETVAHFRQVFITGTVLKITLYFSKCFAEYNFKTGDNFLGSVYNIHKLMYVVWAWDLGTLSSDTKSMGEDLHQCKWLRLKLHVWGKQFS